MKRSSYAILMLTLCVVAFLLSGCQHPKPPPEPVPAAVVTQVTNPAPAIQQVSRSVTRVEGKVEATAIKVEAVEAKADKILEDAIRSQNATLETAMRPLRDELRATRIESALAKEQARNATDDIAALDSALKASSAERDEAVRQREELRVKAERDAMVRESRVAHATGERDRAEADLRKWRKNALWTWGIIGALAALFIAWKVYGPKF